MTPEQLKAYRETLKTACADNLDERYDANLELLGDDPDARERLDAIIDEKIRRLQLVAPRNLRQEYFRLFGKRGHV